MRKLTLGSLFSGSGGFELAGLLNGIEPVWASEIEPFPIMVTKKRFPNMKHFGDVSKINGGEIEPVDIITFGSPCQDLSLAGKRAGIEGSRSSLFFEAVRIIKEMRGKTNGQYPKWIVWENVTGAFSSNKGEDFKAVLEGILGIKRAGVSVPRPEKWLHAGLIMGDTYSVAWRVLDAQFWGVPQRRKRIFLVGDLNGGGAGKVLFESDGLFGNTAESGETWQRVARDPQSGVRATGIENHPNDSRVKLTGDTVQSLTSRMGTGGGQCATVPRLLMGWGGINPTLTANSNNQRMPDKGGLGAVIIGTDLQSINLTGGWHQP